jgi:S-adenosylmethionine decarboxylase
VSDTVGEAGVEWLIEARGCSPASLRSLETLRGLCARVVGELELRVIGEPQWHQFPGEAGVTGLWLLAESHLTCHTFPEHRLATLNLYCCRPRPAWPWAERLVELLGAAEVQVRVLSR